MPLLASRLGRAAAGLGQGQTPSTLPERAQKAVRSPKLESQRGRHLHAGHQMAGEESQMATTQPGRVQRAMRSPMLGSQRGRHLQARRKRVIGRQRRLQRVTRRAAPLPQMAWDCPRLLAH